MTEAGIAAAERMGAYLREAGLLPDLVLVSPARRTRETFEAAERAAKAEMNACYEPAIYGAGSAVLCALIAHTPADVKTLLMVGHNPGLAEAAVALAGEGKRSELARMRRHFPAPCLAVLDFKAKYWDEARVGKGRLDRFVTQDSLAD